MKIAALLMAAFFLVSCGKGGKPVTPKQRGLTKGGGDQNQNDPTKVACPAVVPASFHRVTLHFNRPLPSHIAVRLDTDASPRISDCADLSQTGPLVSYSRLTSNDLVVNVEHRGFYASLPRDTGFEIYDLRACGSEMTSFYKVAPAVPVTWRMESPNGTNCAGRAVGDYKGDAAGLVGDTFEHY